MSSEQQKTLNEPLASQATPSHVYRVLAPFAILVLGLVLYLPGLGWGLPATVSWSQDTIAGGRTLGAVEDWPERWNGRYPPLHYLILAATYQPLLLHWDNTGERVADPTGEGMVLRPPHAPKISRLILIARAVSVVMAIAAGIGLWAATRLFTGDDLAALLAAVTLMIGAAYTYFAHLGNVDIPSMCWFAWSVYFFARLLRSRAWIDVLLLGLFGSLAISTKDALAGVYPGMALVLLAFETRSRMGECGFGKALIRALLQPKWVVGLAAFLLPYLLLYGTLTDPEAYIARMKYWLTPPADTLHAQQHRYANQLSLLWATIYYAAGAVGWPMLAAMGGAVIYAARKHGYLALTVLVPAVTYYIIVIAQIHFVYSRFLFPVIALVAILTGVSGAALWRRRSWPAPIRIGVPSIVILFSLGYTLAINAELITDSRYQAERWFLDNVPTSTGIGAFAHPQYLPRLTELGYPTYRVSMARVSFDQPQPEYLVLSSYNYTDFDAREHDCRRALVAGELGYSPVVTFRGRFLGTGSSWLSLAGWGAPIPGKISPTTIILRRECPS